MLVLTRQVGEAIIIGREVKVRVLEVKGASVRIGIEAPKSIPVYRDEIYAAARNREDGGDSAPPGDPTKPQ